MIENKEILEFADGIVIDKALKVKDSFFIANYILNKLKNQTIEIVIIASVKEYTLQTARYNIFDYLIKPSITKESNPDSNDSFSTVIV